MERFYRNEGGARKLQAKEKKGLFQKGSFSLRGEGEGSYYTDYLAFLWVIEEVQETGYLLGGDQKIPDWPVKTYISEGGWNYN